MQLEYGIKVLSVSITSNNTVPVVISNSMGVYVKDVLSTQYSLGAMVMVSLALQIVSQLQVAKRKEDEYLTFTFFEKNHGMELEAAGWTKLRPPPDKPDYIRGDINPWGCEIPVIDLKILYGKGPTEMTATTCIVIFKHTETYQYYFGMVVGELSNVINIADGTENKMSPLLLSAKWHLSTNPTVKN